MEQGATAEDNVLVRLLAGSVGNPDGTPFQVQVTRKAACMSELIKSMLADDDDVDEVPEIPLLEVPREVLELVVAFINKHCNDPMRTIPKPIPTSDIKQLVSEWDAEFIDLEQEKLYRVILAANYLDIPSLLDLGITKFCCMIKDKNLDEIKQMLNIEGDITPEEERRIREKNDWIWDVHKSA